MRVDRPGAGFDSLFGGGGQSPALRCHTVKASRNQARQVRHGREERQVQAQRQSADVLNFRAYEVVFDGAPGPNRASSWRGFMACPVQIAAGAAVLAATTTCGSWRDSRTSGAGADLDDGLLEPFRMETQPAGDQDQGAVAGELVTMATHEPVDRLLGRQVVFDCGE